MAEALVFSILTPHGTVVKQPVRSVRLPAESGHVGLRPRQEPFVLAVEAGLVMMQAADGTLYAATAGGLLDARRDEARLYTPFAVTGRDDESVLGALDHALATPDSELAARRRLGELEQRIVQELRHRPRALKVRPTHG